MAREWTDEEVQKEIADAVAIVREDRFEAFVRGRLAYNDDKESDDDKGGDDSGTNDESKKRTKSDPPPQKDPPADPPKVKRSSLFFGEIDDD